MKISHFITGEWLHPVHNHNHFEIIYIHRGKGVHQLSGMAYPFEGSSLFLLAPCDQHSFEIAEETEFTFLKFTNVYLNGVGNARMNRQWNQEMDQLLVQARSRLMPLPASVLEKGHVEGLMRLIVGEWKDGQGESSETIYFLVQALLAMIRHHAGGVSTAAGRKYTDKIAAILQYLHNHIYSPGDIHLEKIAAEFGYSRHYLGIFFKEQTGITFRDYVNQYKLHLIENRLQFGSLSLKEISSEMGFSDMSHFNKFFRGQKGVSPSQYRSSTPKV